MMGATALEMYIQFHAARILVKDSVDIAMDRRQEDDFVSASARLPTSIWAHSGEGLGRAAARLPRPEAAVRPTHGHDQTRRKSQTRFSKKKHFSFAGRTKNYFFRRPGTTGRAVAKALQPRAAAHNKVTTKSREFHFFIFFHLRRRRSAFPPTFITTSQGTFFSCRPAFLQVDEKELGQKGHIPRGKNSTQN